MPGAAKSNKKHGSPSQVRSSATDFLKLEDICRQGDPLFMLSSGSQGFHHCFSREAKVLEFYQFEGARKSRMLRITEEIRVVDGEEVPFCIPNIWVSEEPMDKTMIKFLLGRDFITTFDDLKKLLHHLRDYPVELEDFDIES